MTLRVSTDAGIATLLVDRPEKRNAFSLAMWEQLAEVAAGLAVDDTVDVVVVRGPAGGPFSAGADISEFETLRSGAAGARRYGETVMAGTGALAALPQPTVALVQGPCMGGGVELALACDLRLADPTARFSVPPARLGVIYPMGSTARLVDAVGPSRAKRLLLTATVLDAAAAAAHGLVDEVHDDVESAVAELAATIARGARVSTRGGKELVRRVLTGQRDEDDATHALHESSYASAEYAEGVRAFLEKRAPDFPRARHP